MKRLTPQTTQPKQTNTQTAHTLTRNLSQTKRRDQSEPKPKEKKRWNPKISDGTSKYKHTKPLDPSARMSETKIISSLKNSKFDSIVATDSLHYAPSTMYDSESPNLWLSNTPYVIPNAQTKPKIWTHRMCYIFIYIFLLWKRCTYSSLQLSLVLLVTVPEVHSLQLRCHVRCYYCCFRYGYRSSVFSSFLKKLMQCAGLMKRVSFISVTQISCYVLKLNCV